MFQAKAITSAKAPGQEHAWFIQRSANGWCGTRDAGDGADKGSCGVMGVVLISSQQAVYTQLLPPGRVGRYLEMNRCARSYTTCAC